MSFLHPHLLNYITHHGPVSWLFNAIDRQNQFDQQQLQQDPNFQRYQNDQWTKNNPYLNGSLPTGDVPTYHPGATSMIPSAVQSSRPNPMQPTNPMIGNPGVGTPANNNNGAGFQSWHGNAEAPFYNPFHR